jgi:hypothetical protein
MIQANLVTLTIVLRKLSDLFVEYRLLGILTVKNFQKQTVRNVRTIRTVRTVRNAREEEKFHLKRFKRSRRPPPQIPLFQQQAGQKPRTPDTILLSRAQRT